MTPTAFKIKQLAETERSNKAQEKLLDAKNKIETAKVIVGGITGALSSFLPFGLDLAKWKRASGTEVNNAIEALESIRGSLRTSNKRLPDDYFKLLKALTKMKGGK